MPAPSPAEAHVAMLGTGSMGGAIAARVAAAGTPVRATTRSAATAAGLPAGIEARSLEQDAGANRWAVDGAAVVVVAVKPAGVVAALEQVADALPEGAAVVSVAAGVPIAAMERVLPAGTAVLRAMPNTPAAIGAGVTGLAAGGGTDAAAVARVRAIFETVGTVLEVPEERIDALSAVSGSGPAYVFYAVERLLASAGRLGFSRDEARALVLGTVDGAVRLLLASGEEPAELRRRVTSPNGTTERAVGVFDRRDVGGVVDEALDAAIARARELASG